MKIPTTRHAETETEIIQNLKEEIVYLKQDNTNKNVIIQILAENQRMQFEKPVHFKIPYWYKILWV